MVFPLKRLGTSQQKKVFQKLARGTTASQYNSQPTFNFFILHLVFKTPQMGTIFLDMKTQTLKFRSSLRRSDKGNRKNEEKKISLKGT